MIHWQKPHCYSFPRDGEFVTEETVFHLIGHTMAMYLFWSNSVHVLLLKAMLPFHARKCIIHRPASKALAGHSSILLQSRQTQEGEKISLPCSKPLWEDCLEQLVRPMPLTNCSNKDYNTTEIIYNSSVIIYFNNIEFNSKKGILWTTIFLFGFGTFNSLCLYLSLLESNYISPYHFLLLSTKTDLYFHTLSIFSIQLPWLLYSFQPLCCRYIKSHSPKNAWFTSVEKLPSKLTKPNGLVWHWKA